MVCKLEFQSHITKKKINKANSMVGIIWRDFKVLNEFFFYLFETLIRPQLAMLFVSLANKNI